MDEEVAKDKPCPNTLCKGTAEPIHHCEEGAAPVLRGWFCTSCGSFDNAVFRERGLGIKEKK